MTLAITRAKGQYPERQNPRTEHPLIYPKPIIEEPLLLATHIPWQPGSLYNNPRPFPDLAPIEPNQAQQLDHAELGGKLTVCVLCYGNFPQSQKHCLESIIASVPEERRDLRIACNDCPQATIDFARTLKPTCVYVNQNNKFKYPVMRQMFWDPNHPITTKYVAWFDDNVWVKNLNWINVLADDIHRQKPEVAAFGPKLYYALKLHGRRDPRDWFLSADWHQGKQFRNRRNTPTPNGDTVHFCSDWFFVLSVEAIRKCNIPDQRLLQKGGDIALGEQLYQNGYQVKDFNAAKDLVYTPPAGQGLRRGRKERFPWQ